MKNQEEEVLNLMEQIDPGWCQNRVNRGLSSGEGLVHAVRDSRQKNGKAVDPGVTDKRFLAVEEEYASPLKRMDMSANSLSPVLRQAFDGGILQVLTRNDPIKAMDTLVSLVANITSTELLRYLPRTELASGFGNCHLILWVERARVLPRGGTLNQDVLDWLVIKLKDAICFASQAGRLSWAPEAESVWDEVYDWVTHDEPGVAGALTARAEAHTLRLSCLYALLDESPLVCEQHVRAAAGVWEYAARSVRHIFGDDYGDPTTDRIIKALLHHPKGLTRTQIHQVFKNHLDRTELTNALNALEAAGKARQEHLQTRGRSAERWVHIDNCEGGSSNG